ncbi:glycosyltransferase family 2 protein [Roseisalinus antarcticus]|uniref:Glycosyl transferase family 2 n=1 Tax=Roseisalinus antarcticus TaxID=254357 RepID=A0A1Y5RQU1_9RHOB|nr:glycosyltransferase family 2 protein [Roseisalinus antarcticus]SLN22971.1 hypothetical protein ROA7023_00674 [Roseisalinus antarcticus]
MRNEGAHLIEWLGYHRAIGFGAAVLCSNDCDDGSDLLLDRLHAAGAVIHIRNAVPPGTPPQHNGTRLALAHLATTPVPWVLHIDADEFLNVHIGAGHVADLIAMAPEAHCIAIGWRNFGDGGHATWPGATLPHFTTREAHPEADDTYFKCLFRPEAFGHAWAHMPNSPRVAAPRLTNAAGEPLKTDNLFSDVPRVRFFPVARAYRPDHACINHYGVKSPDVFTMKRGRGRGENTKGAGKYRLGSEWHRRANRNEVEDRSILRHLSATETEMNRLRALPGVAEAEAMCQTWFDAARRGEPAE